jgi:FkbM family methyltransferase
MNTEETILASKSKYVDLLGKEQTLKMIALFNEIENGKYNKNEIHTFNVKGLRHQIHLRAIRADIQSFVNTFIEPYLEKKPYLADAQFVIDAGANIGYTAVLYANWWPNSKIVSIEPDLENYNLTKTNTRFYSNIEVIHGAVWNKKANLKIEAGQEDGFVVREVQNTNGIAHENLTTGYTLDELLERYKATNIDFLKMNVEGSEKEVFEENYTNWLPKTKAMLIELHDGKNAGCSKVVFNTVNKYEFAVAETANYGILFVEQTKYRTWYAKWYKEEIYKPNINKSRFPTFYLDQN